MTNPQDHFAEATRQGQDAVLGVAKAWADSVQKLTSAAPGVSGQTPNVTELVDNAFGFAEQLLAAQHEFVKSLLQTVSPAVAATAQSGSDAAQRNADAAGDAGASTRRTGTSTGTGKA